MTAATTLEKTTPLLSLHLFRMHQMAGAKFGPFAGYDMPVQYVNGIIHEQQWTRSHASLFDVSHMVQVLFKSKHGYNELARALESVIPSDIQSLNPGQMKYSVLLNAQGGIVDDTIIARRNDDFYLVLNAACKHKDLEFLSGTLPSTVDFEVLESWGMLALQGPKAATIVRQINPAIVDLMFMQGAFFRLGSAHCFVSRTGYTGEDGFEIAVPADKMAHVAELLLSSTDVHWAGLGARDILRLEAGLCLYGHDLNESTSPLEAGIGWIVGARRKKEGGFLGFDRFKYELEYGISRKRLGFVMEGRSIPREGASILFRSSEEHDFEEVGVITSGGFSPSLEKPIAMGYVQVNNKHQSVDQNHKDGQNHKNGQWGIQIRKDIHKACLTKMPFVQHRYRQIKG